MSEFYAVCFDVFDSKRLRLVANELENYGSRVQRSLFECYLDVGQLAELKERIAGLIDDEKDYVAYYPLCPKDAPQVIVDGGGKRTTDADYFLL